MRLLKALGICTALVAAGFFVSGFVADFMKSPEPAHVIKYVARPGDTLNGIAHDHYKLQKPGLMSEDDYALQVRITNNKLHNPSRMLQPGDEVKVPVFEQ